MGNIPEAESGGSRMSREVHVRFCEGLGLQCPGLLNPYVPTSEGWLYLSIIMDLYSRKVIGWAMSDRMTDLRRQIRRRSVRDEDAGVQSPVL